MSTFAATVLTAVLLMSSPTASLSLAQTVNVPVTSTGSSSPLISTNSIEVGDGITFWEWIRRYLHY